MEIVLGVSMTPTTVSIALVEGEKADGVIVERDVFDITAIDGSATSSASDHVIAAILGTQEGAIAAGHHLVSTGVTWTHHAQAAVLREALVARGIEDVLLVSELHAAAALAQAVGRAVGYDKTALMFVEQDTATLAVVETADGSVVRVLSQGLHSADTIAVLTEMVTSLQAEKSMPQGMFIVGSDVDVTAVKAHLKDVVSVPVIAPEEPAAGVGARRCAGVGECAALRHVHRRPCLLTRSRRDHGLPASPGRWRHHVPWRRRLIPGHRRHRFGPRRRAGTQQAVPVDGQLADRHLRSGNDGTGHRNGDQCPADRGSRLGRA